MARRVREAEGVRCRRVVAGVAAWLTVHLAYRRGELAVVGLLAASVLGGFAVEAWHRRAPALLDRLEAEPPRLAALTRTPGARTEDVTALHPPAVWSSDRNNASPVLRVEWGLAAVLLTGDAETPAERDVLAAGLPVQAPILKVGHHGSRNASSNAFLDTVAPRLARISVGARNPFGHPTPAALGRLADAGAAIYRTDDDGAVEVVSDAARLTVRQWARPDVTEEWLLRGAP